MQSSFIRRAMPKITLALVALTVGVFLSRGDPANAVVGSPSFTPSMTTALSSLNASARADITQTLTIPLNDYNFSALINGTPGEAFVAPGPGNPGYALGADPALGDVMGTLTSTSWTVGLFGGPCIGGVFPNFTFLNATVDITDTIDAVPQLAVNPGGSGGTLDNMWSDDGSSVTGLQALPPWNSAWPGMDDPGAPGGADDEKANKLPAQVDEYPSYLNIFFDPDFPLTPGTNAVQPLARYAGAVNVVGTTVVLDIVVFAPGALLAFPAGHPFNTAAGMLGYTYIAVLNDTTTAAAPSSMTDSCTPLNTTTKLFGLSQANNCISPPLVACVGGPAISNPPTVPPPAGCCAKKFARYANPAVPGPYSWDNMVVSLRDADLDGIENSLDTCPYSKEIAPVTPVAYNPRTGLPVSEDPDSDGIPGRDNPGIGGEQLLAGTGCDPTPLTDTNAKDHDFDGGPFIWLNTGDNCPLVPNFLQTDLDLFFVGGGGGPLGDGIGDDCDLDPPPVPNGDYWVTMTLNPETIVNNDTDPGTGDGYSASAESGTPLCGNAKNDDDKVNTPANPFPAALAADDAVVDDGCGAIPIAGTYSEATFKIGTSATGRCGMGIEAGPSAQWPSDFVSGGVPNSTDRINVTDLTSFIAPVALKRLNTSPGTPTFDKRWDISPGRGVFTPMINVTDLTSLIAASSGFPPMMGGAVKAFSGPVCPGD